MVPVASAITPINELALALTSGQEIKLAVSVGQVIIWITIIAVRPDDHQMWQIVTHIKVYTTVMYTIKIEQNHQNMLLLKLKRSHQ